MMTTTMTKTKMMTTMTTMMGGLLLGLALLGSAPAFATTTTVGTAAPLPPDIILAEEMLPIHEILHMEPSHLLALAGGIVAGVTVAGPYLGLSELLSVALGFAVGEAFYRSPLWPLHKGWLE